MVGQVSLGQLGQVRVGQGRLGQFRIVRLGQGRLGYVRLGQVWLGQFRLGQVVFTVWQTLLVWRWFDRVSVCLSVCDVISVPEQLGRTVFFNDMAGCNFPNIQSVQRLAASQTVRGSHPGCSEILRSRPDGSGTPSSLYDWYWVSFLRAKRPGRGVELPPQSDAEVEERVEL